MQIKMMNNTQSYLLQPKFARNCFLAFVLYHSLLWIVVPFFSRASLPHDVLEGISWGLQWQWGYNKHPFLTGWLLALGSQWSKVPNLYVYILAQVAVAVTFITVWRLARYFLPPVQALISAAALDGIFFYNINSFNFTPDTLQSPLWALFTLFFFLAVRKELLRFWLLAAFFAVLAMMTKYQSVILLICAFIFTLIDPHARACYRQKNVYLAIGLFLLLLTPHLLWLYQHDFITVKYAFGTASDYGDAIGRAHFYYPYVYLSDCIGAVSGLFIVLWPFYRSEREALNLSAFQWRFLLMFALGPFFLTLILNIISGEYYPGRWATPYFSLLGILLLALLRPVLTTKTIKQFMISLIIFSTLLGFGRYAKAVFIPRESSDAWLPNQQIAGEISSIWNSRYSRPLKYLAGSHYLVAAVVPYMSPRPIPYFSNDREDSAWVDSSQFKKYGGIFIWDLEKNYVWDQYSKKYAEIPEDIRKQFPRLEWVGNYTFYRQLKHSVKVPVAVAILPPE